MSRKLKKLMRPFFIWVLGFDESRLIEGVTN